jgi:hypothetical protein
MNNLYFFLTMVVGMYIGRKIGWVFSRTILYHPKISNYSTAIWCITWGILIAYLVHLSINLQHPYIIIKIIFGYALGGYVCIPNYGLVDESTLPFEKIYHHKLISNVSLTTYILAIILFEIFF